MSTWSQDDVMPEICGVNCGRAGGGPPFIEHHDLAKALLERIPDTVGTALTEQRASRPKLQARDVASNMVAWYSQAISKEQGRDAEAVVCPVCGQALKRRRHPQAGADEIWSYRIVRD